MTTGAFAVSTSCAEQLHRQCVDCARFAPQTDTDYTLISSKFGWRLTPRTVFGGRRVLEWRCPTCWEAHKAESGSTPPSRVVRR